MRILVVEDVPAFANAIAEGLRDQAMAVDVAYDGHEAAAKLDLNPYDVVVLDRDLPGIHGDTLCQMIAESQEGPMIRRDRARPAHGNRRPRWTADQPDGQGTGRTGSAAQSQPRRPDRGSAAPAGLG